MEQVIWFVGAGVVGIVVLVVSMAAVMIPMAVWELTDMSYHIKKRMPRIPGIRTLGNTVLLIIALGMISVFTLMLLQDSGWVKLPDSVAALVSEKDARC
jgi:hypothetical protein